MRHPAVSLVNRPIVLRLFIIWPVPLDHLQLVRGRSCLRHALEARRLALPESKAPNVSYVS